MKMGRSTRKNTEDAWLWVRGNPKRMDAGVRELIVAPVREHSRKPEESFAAAEKLCGDVDRLELFSRQPRSGWDVFGNEVDKFNDTQR